MNRQTEIIVERFAQGITSRCKRTLDVSGLDKLSKALGIHGTECCTIGKEIWEDVSELLNESMTDKVRIRLEYEPMED